jgi:hypothetical protein
MSSWTTFFVLLFDDLSQLRIASLLDNISNSANDCPCSGVLDAVAHCQLESVRGAPHVLNCGWQVQVPLSNFSVSCVVIILAVIASWHLSGGGCLQILKYRRSRSHATVPYWYLLFVVNKFFLKPFKVDKKHY